MITLYFFGENGSGCGSKDRDLRGRDHRMLNRVHTFKELAHSRPESLTFFEKKVNEIQVHRSQCSDRVSQQTGYVGVSTTSKNSISDDFPEFR